MLALTSTPAEVAIIVHAHTAELLTRIEPDPRHGERWTMANINVHPADCTRPHHQCPAGDIRTSDVHTALFRRSAGPLPAAPRRRGAREVFGLILLVSGFPPLLGWLAGVGLVLWSPLWTARQKLLGILVWPGGLTVAIGASLMLGASSDGLSCDITTDGRRIERGCVSVDSGMHPAVMAILIAVVVAAPLVVGLYLYRAAGRGTAAT